MTRPSTLYQRLVDKKEILADSVQAEYLPQLDAIYTELKQKNSPKGVYLYGPVGRGKSMLMQLLFDAAPIRAKRRVHFHPFMEELHHRMHKLKPPKGVDPMAYLAKEIAGDAKLLCFDEFFVTNIGDAMFLGRLLQALFAAGVTLCATSNWAPDDLYQEGFNRGRFMPFINVVKSHMSVLEIDSPTDYRTLNTTDAAPVHIDSTTLFQLWSGESPKPHQRPLGYHTLQLKGSAHYIAWTTLTELCGSNLGRSEYLDFCKDLKGLIIDAPEAITNPDIAMRLVVLVDILYENMIPTRLQTAEQLTDLIHVKDMELAIARMESRLNQLERLEP